MRTKAFIPYLFLLTMLISVTAILNADANKFGIIKGTITDNSDKPVVGASILIVGTNRGAITDKEGKFIIIKVPPGSYNLKISCIGYTSTTIKAVTVLVGQATESSYQLVKAVEELDAVISVRGKTDILDKFCTSNEVTINKDRKYINPKVGIPKPVQEIKQSIQSLSLGRKVNTFKVGIPEPASNSPAHGGTAIVNNEAFDAMFFKNYGVNPFVDTEDDHLSTFAIDVDDASFVMTRSYLNRGALPPNEAIRTEEFVNHFKYNYAAPNNETFRVFTEGAPSRFGQNSYMLKIGIKGMEVSKENRKNANLVFVIDVSGSMARENRLGLVKQALRLLVDELTYQDRVGIVAYGSTGQVILKPTSLENKAQIIRAIESLYTNGTTNAEEGIMMGYKMAKGQYEPGKINRVILCSDGVANVGRTGPDQLLKQIKEYADLGITLSTVGFGMANYNDILMEKLGNKGNGHYAYVDNLSEAKKIFVDNLTGNLQVIARDVKIQVDFNRDFVKSYRLLGYENRDVEDNKFRDDKEDGGEIGAGHQVTALYEIKFHKNNFRRIKRAFHTIDNIGTIRTIGTIFIRYKDPDTKEVTEINRALTRSDFNESFQQSSQDFKIASCAAEFAEILRKSYWAKGSKLSDVLTLAKELTQEQTSADLIELLSLISKAEQFKDQLAQN